MHIHLYQKNRVIMKISYATNDRTLAHELGHFFSLLHKHSTSFGEELAGGSNCDIAGNLFCYTPADSRLSTSNVNSSCAYTELELTVMRTFTHQMLAISCNIVENLLGIIFRKSNSIK
jgi:hypothetical protein